MTVIQDGGLRCYSSCDNHEKVVIPIFATRSLLGMIFWLLMSSYCPNFFFIWSIIICMFICGHFISLKLTIFVILVLFGWYLNIIIFLFLKAFLSTLVCFYFAELILFSKFFILLLLLSLSAKGWVHWFGGLDGIWRLWRKYVQMWGYDSLVE